MRIASPAVLILLGILLADPAGAQTRKGDVRRATDRERTAERQRETERDTRTRDRDTDVRGWVPRDRPAPRHDDDRDARDRDTRERDYDHDRDIIDPILVYGIGVGRYDRYDRYDRYGYDYGSGRHVWNRTPGMSCLQLDDELEWAHDEWHYRNDRHRGTSWYDVEHARLQWRIEEERAYSRCGRSHDDRDCSERGRYPRSGSSLEIAILVLDILLGGGRR